MTNRIYLAGVAFTIQALLAFPVAFGGSIIEQVVTTQLDKESVTAKYSWDIDGEKFKLRVSSGSGDASYVFNGKNFYVCSKVADEPISQLKAMKVVDTQLLKDLANGSCQAVPANFMARFFLSPAGAVSSLDASDGMELTLEMGNYAFKSEGQGQSNKENCSLASRNFEVTRKMDNSTGRYNKVDEKICFTNKYDWRKSFWKQISRNLVRQPSAKGLFKSLQEDSSKLQGFVLTSSGTFEKADANGVTKKGSRTIETTSIKESAIASSEFATPPGYVVIDVQSKILASKNVSDAKLKDADVDNTVSTIVYFILRGVL